MENYFFCKDFETSMPQLILWLNSWATIFNATVIIEKLLDICLHK